MHRSTPGREPMLHIRIPRLAGARRLTRLLAFTLLVAAATSAVAVDSGPLAFPGAQGSAAHTPGGRGGAVLRVTTLAADGPGSLKAALMAKGPRTVVFEVGGV